MKITYKIVQVVAPTAVHALMALEPEVNRMMAEGFDSLGHAHLGAANGGVVAYKEMVRYEYADESEDVGFIETPKPPAKDKPVIPVKPKGKVVA